MLDVVNRFADGFVAIPVIDSCHRGGIFKALLEGPWDTNGLAAAAGANPGYLRVALRVLDGLGWVDMTGEITARLTDLGRTLVQQIPEDLAAMLAALPHDVTGDGSALTPWLERCALGWADGSAPHPLAALLEGMLLAPVLVDLDQRGGMQALDAGQEPFGADATRALLEFLSSRGWAQRDANGLRLNGAGRYLVESGAKLGTVVSYWPMFLQMDTLLFGDAATVFDRDADGHERHLDRRLNVFGSTAQHGSFFREMEDAVVVYFDLLPLDAQPTHIADLGCGDGTLLKRLYAAVVKRTSRGAELGRYPLTLIAADFNEKSLEAAREGLADLPHLTVQADIGDPAGFAAALAERGVDPGGVLHVRSFVDHDRPLLAPRDLGTFQARGDVSDSGAHVDEAGGLIDRATAVQSLVEHLARWRASVGRHGMLILEVHCLPPAVTRRLNHESEALHFDAYHSFARQHLVEATTFLLAAAEAGLVPQTRTALRFPRRAPYTRITLNRFFPTPYRIRLAHESDVPALLALEEASVAPTLRTPEAQIIQRLRAFPKGQLVLEYDGELAGALYTQRISDPNLLSAVTIDDVESLHRDDGAVGQLLWFVVDPDRREQIDTGELLDFALDYLAAMDGIQYVVGVTRCREFMRRSDSSETHADYVARRDRNGLPVDPILLMHASHGARIERILEGFRPRDLDNGGAGVLIAYALDDRHAASAGVILPKAVGVIGQSLETMVREEVERVLGPSRLSAFQSGRALMDMGLESLDLLELRRGLSERLGVVLDPTFFFQYGTPDAVIRHFSVPAEPVAVSPLPAVERVDSGSPSGEGGMGGDGYAVIGLACRMPGDVYDGASFWDLLVRGGDGVRDIPAERWRLFGTGGLPADGLPPQGALLSDIDRFDASFFQISPREAALLDPQQRLLLETAWQALENAGIDPASLAGTATGLFLGLMGHDYETLLLRSGIEEIDGHFATGNSGSIAAGRISHFFDFHGPAITIDTACSSSLVAVHQACRALRAGDCSMAVVGGVNLTLSAHASVSYLRAGMLSPDGRCKTFDASANGYGRGEGVGVVVLKRLAEAERDGDRVLAVIRGSAVNQDGTGIGLTAPNQTAQSDLIRAALADAHLSPVDVSYLECHGTGTSLGDPIEVGAAASVLGTGREASRPLLLGSVKSNIGHLEAAAGIAGLIKVVLSLGAGELPGQAHFRVPNPHIAWDALAVEVVRERRPWPPGRRIAGVSSFGFSGTNAHVVLEGPPAVAATPAGTLPPRGVDVLVLSAKSEAALSEVAARHADWLAATPAVSLGDLCFTAGAGRSHFAYRAAVVAAGREELAAGLAALRAGGAHGSLHRGRRRGGARVGVLFTGQGSQWAGMARGLYTSEPVFRAVVDRCAAAVDGITGAVAGGAFAGGRAGLLEVMFAPPGSALAALLDETSYTQAALYAVQCGLWALWRSWGVRAEAVLGHSVGEFAAAHAAGVLSLEDGARLVARRGVLMGALPAGGAMAVVFAPASAVAAELARVNARAEELSGGIGLSLAGENGTHRVVSGPSALIEVLMEGFAARGTRCQRLTVSHAFHSALLDPMLDDLEAAAAAVTHEAPRLALVSNLTGGVFAEGTRPDGAYWRRHAREPVRYAEGVATLAGLGVDVLLELGPRPVLGPLALGCWPNTGAGAETPVSLASLRPGLADERALADAVAGLYAAGGTIDFAARDADRGLRRIAAPGYPFERTRHWIDAAGGNATARGLMRSAGHKLLGVEHRAASGEASWTRDISATDPGWLAEHTVFGAVVAPGALHACLAAAAGSLPVSVRDGQIEAPLVLTERAMTLQLVLPAPGEDGRRGWQVFAREADAAADGPWRCHARGWLTEAGAPDMPAAVADTALRERDVAGFYDQVAALGIVYGPGFQGVERLWGGAGVARGEIVAPDGMAGPDMVLHPAVLDACLQVLMAALPEDAAAGDPYVPLGWEALDLWAPAPRRVTCEVRLRPAPGDAPGGVPGSVIVADLWLRDAAGALFGRVKGLMLKRAARHALLGAAAGVDELLYEMAWREVPVPASTAALTVAVGTLEQAVRPRVAALAAALGFEAERQARLEVRLEHAARAFALAGLERLGWRPRLGETIVTETLRVQLNVLAEHTRLFARLLGLLGEAGLLAAEADGAGGTAWRVIGTTLADAEPSSGIDPEEENAVAWVLLSRCGAALAEVLRGTVAPLGLLFPEQGVGAADLYREAPDARLMNAILAATIERAVAELPPGRRLRVLEVGAGTGGTSGVVLPLLARERTDYVYTDVSAGFFAGAEARFGAAYPFVSYRTLDIERDPATQGFAAGGYDLVIASNVLHATRDIVAAAAHCRTLLAPGGLLVLLEELERRGWTDLTFGLLDGWWRFSDAPLRQEHALLDTARWRTALAAAGYAETTLLHPDEREARAVVLARTSDTAAGATGLWLLAADQGGTAERLSAALRARGQHVVLATPGAVGDTDGAAEETPGIMIADASAGAGTETRWRGRLRDTADWRALLGALPTSVPLRGVVHLAALDAARADDPAATTARLAADTQAAVGGALALAQALIGHDMAPASGTWFVTEGAQVVAGEPAERLAGAALWGMARTLAREHPELNPRRLDLEARPETVVDTAALLEELLAPDAEDEVARRGPVRLAPRLIRAGRESERLTPPAHGAWRLAKGDDRTLASLRFETVEPPPLGAGEVEIAIEAAGLNFRDVLDTLGMVPVDAGPLGGEFAGRVVATGEGVTGLAPGSRVVGLGVGCFGGRVITQAALVAPCPDGLTPAAAATLPTVFLTAALAFEWAKPRAGERVLIHAGAGGVGLAAIQLAQAAGAEVFATASAAKRDYLRGLGVRHVYDSRGTDFAAEILAATGGRGVDVVLNSLTSEGFVAASLSALAPDGRFVEIAKRGVWTPEEVAAARPGASYLVLAVDRLMAEEPARTGAALRAVIARVAAGELRALPRVTYPLSEVRLAMRHMQQARHIGKIVLTPPRTPAGTPVRAGVTYLITGGLGGIGLAVAGWLADRGATHLVLNGRRAPDAAAEAAVQALRERGVTVAVMLADVSRAAEVERLLADMDAGMPALAGVIHSVGLLRDGAVANQDWDRFAEVLGPKQLGGWQLHLATRDRPLDLFVLFASTAGLLGNRGQANHAAANVFLDQLARHRRAEGLAGLSIDWGAWSEIGEAAERREALNAVMEAAGIGWMTPAQGLAALERALASDLAQVGVVAADWRRTGVGASGLLVELLAEEQAARAPTRPTRTIAIRQRLARTPAERRRAELTAWLAEALQRVLRLQEVPEGGMRFSDLGMDSLMTVELRNRLNTELELDPPLPATVLFDYPTLDLLAGIIESQLTSPVAESQVEAEDVRPAEPIPVEISTAVDDTPPAAIQATRKVVPTVVARETPGKAPPAREDLSDKIAIVGMACRFPLAPNLAAYWRLLVDGRDAIAPIPPERSDVAGVANESTLPRWAGLLEGIEDFDPGLFRISPDEAPYIDPQHRLLLESAWHALENAGIPAAQLAGSNTGVFIGIGAADYAMRHANDLGTLSPHSGAGSGGFAAANRISHVFDFTGPSFAVNTACASSLTALHLAVTSLKAGECDLALVGGVNLMLHPSEFVSLFKAQVLSPTGRCRSFSVDADGYVRSEGCGVIVLRRHADAVAAGDRIDAIIRGTAISHVGASNGLSAPNGPAQEAVMRTAIARAGIDPAMIDYLEAQGTGTPIGDAIEMGAICNVMTPGREPTHPLRVGAVKTNIGNVEEASGMAGLIKTVLAMKHGLIPPTLHFRGFNQNIRIGKAPVRVVTAAESWPRNHGKRRIAALNGFGFAGANVHVVLQEAVPNNPEDSVNLGDGDAPLPILLTVRARTLSNVQRMAAMYADALAMCAPADVHRFCVAANTGRGEMGHRLAVIGADRDTLLSRLRAAAVDTAGPGIFMSKDGTPRRNRAAFLFSDRTPLDHPPVTSLYASEPVFRAVLDRCAAQYQALGEGSLLDLVMTPVAESCDGEAALCALQLALSALLESWGIKPDFVVGLGAGEVAAASCAGVIDPEAAMSLAVDRSRWRIQADKSRSPALPLTNRLSYAAARRRLFLAVGDVPVPEDHTGWPAYWADLANRCADFRPVLERVNATGANVFIEIGPSSGLIDAVRAGLPKQNAVYLPSLRTGQLPDRAAMIELLASLFVAGSPVDFAGLHGARGPGRIDVPLYAFERERYALEDVLSHDGAPDDQVTRNAAN